MNMVKQVALNFSYKTPQEWDSSLVQSIRGATAGRLLREIGEEFDLVLWEWVESNVRESSMWY